jgi:hypothetical protein
MARARRALARKKPPPRIRIGDGGIGRFSGFTNPRRNTDALNLNPEERNVDFRSPGIPFSLRDAIFNQPHRCSRRIPRCDAGHSDGRAVAKVAIDVWRRSELA